MPEPLKRQKGINELDWPKDSESSRFTLSRQNAMTEDDWKVNESNESKNFIEEFNRKYPALQKQDRISGLGNRGGKKKSRKQKKSLKRKSRKARKSHKKRR